MLRKDLWPWSRRRSPLLRSEFYISRLWPRKGIWTSFPKRSIFHLSIVLRKWSHAFITKLVFHITGTSMQRCLCRKRKKKKSNFSLIPWAQCGTKKGGKSGKSWKQGLCFSHRVVILVGCASCFCICAVFTLKIIAHWCWRKKSPVPQNKKILLKCVLKDCQPFSNKCLTCLWMRSL